MTFEEWLKSYVATHGIYCAVDAPHYFALDVWNAAIEAAKPRWIPVEERLPKDGVDCAALMLDLDDSIHMRFFADGEFQKPNSQLVTHWLELPELPE